MKRLLSRTASCALLITGIGLTTVIAGALIITSLVGPKPVIDAVSCQLGFSQTCLLQELRQEKKKLRKLQGRTAELEALYKRLSKLDHASSSYAVFYHDKKGKFTVSTGVKYVSLVKPGTLTSGWCYIRLSSSGSLDQNLHIANMDSKLKVTKNTFSAKRLSKIRLTQKDVSQALSRCKWPEGAS